MSLNWGGNVVQMPRRDPDWSEMAEMFDVPRITEVRHASEDKDFAEFYKREQGNGPRMLTLAVGIAAVIAGLALFAWWVRG